MFRCLNNCNYCFATANDLISVCYAELMPKFCESLKDFFLNFVNIHTSHCLLGMLESASALTYVKGILGKVILIFHLIFYDNQKITSKINVT